jgi:hypothetical protein
LPYERSRENRSWTPARGVTLREISNFRIVACKTSFVFAGLLLASVSYAQTTFATITGNITDPTGLAIVGAKVQAVQVETGYKYGAQTNESGVYTLPNLKDGTYDVTVTATGFRECQAKSLILASREIRRLDVKLEVGTITTTVDVGAEGAAVIETETARISQTRTAEELKDLPMNNRSIRGFLGLVPGVGQATTVTSTYRFAGSRRNQSEFHY